MFIKCSCDRCSGHIEFDASNAGQAVDCPHCGQSTVLLVAVTPAASGPVPLPRAASTTTVAAEPVLVLPRLADESLRSIQVRSSDGARYYAVNLLDYTCTCPSFVNDHSMVGPRDVGRLCKHLCQQLNRPEIVPLLHPILAAMVRGGFGVLPGRLACDNNGNRMYVTGVGNTGWLNVFALKRRNGKTYYEFGYNVNEERWAYGAKPQVDETVLFQEHLRPSSPSQSTSPAWNILAVTFRFVGRMLILISQCFAWLFLAVLAGLLASGVKGRRKRR